MKLGSALLLAFLLCPAVHAWGPDAHRHVGAVADRLLHGTRAASRVRAILGNLSLQDASVWADCAKGVTREPRGLAYTAAGRFSECAIFESPSGKAELVDFVARNARGCERAAGEELCHKQHHHADISIARNRYDVAFAGARDDDVVHAVVAAIRVLQGGVAPAPFSIRTDREALLLLAHHVGDLHQPLHVGAVYLSARGRRLDPGRKRFDPATSTRGGNRIVVNQVNLHALWDASPSFLTPSSLVAEARRIPRTAGPIDAWPTIWAGETVREARVAFTDVTFGRKDDGIWPAELGGGYSEAARSIKKTQLARAGARLAQTLQTLWP